MKPFFKQTVSKVCISKSSSVVLPIALALILTIPRAGTSYANPDGSGSYKLAPGDRVSIVVLGQPEFSGDHMIDNDGSVTLPAVGLVGLKDLTASEAEKVIVERLANGYLQQPIASVRVTEPRPIYVVGDVRTPGSYPFRYGISVMGALALAGGFRVAEQLPSGARSEFLMADERLRVLQASRRSLLVRKARLEAQLEGASQIALQDSFPFSREDPEVLRILQDEQGIMTTQKKGHEQELRLLREQGPRLDAEAVAVQQQSESEKKQLELIQMTLADYNNLVSSGLTRRFQLIEYQRQEATYKSSVARLAAEQVNLEIRKGEIAMRLQESENNYKQRILTDLQDVRARLSEIEITLPVAREVREARLQQGGGATLAGSATEVSHTAIIHRIRDGKTESFQADTRTPLAPGDIVEMRPSSREAASLGASSQTNMAMQAESLAQDALSKSR
ncbi:polysaccharide biosynthesis/export family protein [Microvirga solisilvae]|uniref:polysaccharide biosynthesis/export family protein n=1 Tax=Microvirga solisilvae TaxID=2919498 RepID=UPI001FAF46EF|nr:polysaccharide biosynthesis/export family protein [Microvirga solisilvae]